MNTLSGVTTKPGDGRAARARCDDPDGPGWTVDPAGIERARVLGGWTQRDLAMAARIDPGTLSDALSIAPPTDAKPLQAICRPLNLTLGDVIRFEDEVGI